MIQRKSKGFLIGKYHQ